MEETSKEANSLKQSLTCPLVVLFPRTLSDYTESFTEVLSNKDLREFRVSKLEVTLGMISRAKTVLRDDLVVPLIMQVKKPQSKGARYDRWLVQDLLALDKCACHVPIPPNTWLGKG